MVDSTDLYAFVSPDAPDTVTLIANYIPLEEPAGGPNFYEFGDNVLYAINIDNDGDGLADISYQFQFTTRLDNPDTFLYNTGPILSLTDRNWNRRQTYTVTRVVEAAGQSSTPTDTSTVLGRNLACPPCNIGPLSTPDYASLAQAAVHSLGTGISVFAGQRAEGFYVDLGAIFDLGDLRPFEGDHTLFGIVGSGLSGSQPGVNATKALNVHTIAIQIPMNQLTASGSNPTDPTESSSVIGVWTTASRQRVSIAGTGGNPPASAGAWIQVSRLGNPLFNEVLVPLSQKDFWNHQPPSADAQFAPLVANPELAQLLPVLYPGVFPNLAAYNAGPPAPDRADLLAILLTGIPSGVVPGFQNFTGSLQADMLRLNMAIPPSSNPQNTGLLGNDPAGYPNGRRVFDDVVTIELRAVAGATLPLVDPSFKADAAAGELQQGLTTGAADLTANGTENYLPTFPYLGVPHSGFTTPSA